MSTTNPTSLFGQTKDLFIHRRQDFFVRRIGLCAGFIFAVLTLISVSAVTSDSLAEVRINHQKNQGSEKQTTTQIEICDTDEKDGVSVRVDVEGFYKLDLKISPECKAAGNKTTNGAEKKEKRK